MSRSLERRYSVISCDILHLPQDQPQLPNSGDADSLVPKRTFPILDVILAHPYSIMNRHEPPSLVLSLSSFLLLLGHPLRSGITIIHALSLVPSFLLIVPTVFDVFCNGRGDMVGLAFRCVVVDYWCGNARGDDVPVAIRSVGWLYRVRGNRVWLTLL